MKTQIRSYLVMVVASLFLLVSLTGCTENALNPTSPGTSILGNGTFSQYKMTEKFVVVPESVTLFAGQTIPAGTITVDVVVDGSGTYQLRVTYTTINAWELTAAHLWVGTDLAEMPQTQKGHPKIGSFPYQSGDMSGATSYTLLVPLSLSVTVCETAPDYLIAAHAVLRKPNGDGADQTETGWGAGERMAEQGSWATYFTIDLVCNSTNPDGNGSGTETAFAFGNALGVCFLTLDENHDGKSDFQRWGWTNGPLSPGNYAFAIYAGAGQCDVTKGTLVGTLQVDYTGETAHVSYQMGTDAAGQPYTLAETHLYLGNEILARDKKGNLTVAPGQYPYIHEGLDGAISDLHTIHNVSGALHLVAHAVVNMP